MPVTIHLNDALASRLRGKASARQQSVEEFAEHLLGEALEKMEAEERWRAVNQRRLALIRKGATVPLSPEEQTELQQLQEALDRRLEPADNQLLDQLAQLEQALRDLPEDSGT
jgi:predicted transcriptional regulator